MVTGAPGSGKSSLGRALAAQLRVPYLSRDDVRWGLLASAGVWSARPVDRSARERARETFLDIVGEVTARGVSAVLEFAVFRDRPEEFERLQRAADCIVIVTSCADASTRVAEREKLDGLLSREGVLTALGHESMDAYLRDAEAGPHGIVEGMSTEFDVPQLGVRTDAGYDPPLDRILDWVVASTGRPWD